MKTVYPPDTIYFYGQTDPFSEFANFAPYGISLDGVWWSTAEHYFQAQKFLDANYREQIRKANRPKDAKSLGTTRAYPLRADWEEIKGEIMHRTVLTKFQTHKSLSDLLLSTGNKLIAESSPHDAYWGCGADGLGLNKLGLILMAVRDQLRK